MRVLFATAALFGFLAVAAGAFGAHALSGRLGEEHLEWFHLAARYQVYHALAMMAAAWAATRWPGSTALLAGWLFAAGIVIFAGSLYAMAFGAPRWFGAITPIGGTAFLAGWALLAWAAIRG